MSGAQSASVAGVKIVVVTDEQAFADSARSAFAASAQVDLEIVREKLRLRVSDQGCGFDPGAKTDGFGLIGMRERVTLAGGTLELESAPGAGTTIVAILPARRRKSEVKDKKAA